MDIKLNFINNSSDANNSQIVIFAKNVAADARDAAVAWKLIENCGPRDNHAFVYPVATTIAGSDRWGNYAPMLQASAGQRFSMEPDPEGDMLKPSGQAGHPAEIEVFNAFPDGTIGAGIYKNYKLYAYADAAPGEKATFQFKPTIWIGVVSELEEGEVMGPAIVSSINTEFSLLGVASADIVMTGGGAGQSATPFVFTLANVTYA
jgi:hypothetical protein